MTIVEHAPYPTDVAVSQPITDDIAYVEPAPTPTRDVARRRQYNHPRRERFVEDAATRREMFRL